MPSDTLGNMPGHAIGSTAVAYGVGYALLPVSAPRRSSRPLPHLHNNRTPPPSAWELYSDCTTLIHIRTRKQAEGAIHHVLRIVGDCSAVRRRDSLGLVMVIDHDEYCAEDCWCDRLRPVPSRA